MRQGWPQVGAGQTVGLLGGSFDPAHDGHVHITEEALSRFGLDWVWWLVSPGNPLKPDAPAPLEDRIAHARRLMRHPRVIVTGIEAALGTRYTAATLDKLVVGYPQARFVWVMGADNLAQFHRWDRWQHIFRTVPIGVLARPEHRLPALTSPAARAFTTARLSVSEASRLGRWTAPAWGFANIPMTAASSTKIRAAGAWTRGERAP